MDIRTVAAWITRNFHPRWCKSLLYIVIVPLAVWHILGAAFRATRFVRSVTASVELTTELDSFSRPSIAAAILKREMNALILAYSDARIKACEDDLGRRSEDVLRNNQQLAAPTQLSVFRRTPNAAIESAPLHGLQTLHSTVQELNMNLDCELMAIYYSNESWNEFLDSYLRLLNEAPEMANAVSTRSALDAAQRCGRNAQVADALRYCLQYHPEVKTARSFAAALQEWQTNHPATMNPASP